MSKEMMIGEFALVTGVSKRMLRHYDKLGLIAPTRTDDSNGYRYYSEDQLATVKTVTILQNYGFSLNEICRLKDQDITAQDFLQLLKAKELHIRQSIDEHTAHLLKIKATINTLQKQSTPGLSDRINLTQLNLEGSQPMTKQENSYITAVSKVKNTLTTLPTTALFLEQVEERIAASPNTSKAFYTFDLDHFASVNDLYGYDIGDRVIYQFFKFILDTFEPLIQKGTAMVSRFGGDEASVYLEDVSEEDAITLAEQIFHTLRAFDFNHLECPRQMTSSCGIYIFSNPSHIQALRHESGMALMEAKRQGRDRVVSRS